jgi:hypothetical protein
MDKRGLAIVTILLSLAAQPVQAGQIVVGAAAPNVLTPANGSMQVLTFEGLTDGALPHFAFSGGSLSGDGAVESTTTGIYARPAGDLTHYLTVAGLLASGDTVIHLDAPTNYFGLYWGSIDAYNLITFLKNGHEVGEYSGSMVASLTGLAANGDQRSTSSNRYINFNFGSLLYDEVILSTTNFAFEVDNVALGAPVRVPEPATALLLMAGLLGLGALCRHRHGLRC